MEYKEIGNLLNDGSNKPSKFRIKNLVEIYISSMLRSSLCYYSDAYILVKGNISVNNNADDGTAANNTDKKSNI